ncbi:MAG: hypothetical protein C5B51_07005 [Terriglobia bacterium]|nr:MAG: hypothetical protein C5B51_07005 [Terriglobia bacterium]
MLVCFLFLFAAAGPAAAQTWDTSGNGLLKGSYYFREVVWLVGDSAGDLSQAISMYGSITFDGNGNYTIDNTKVMDSNASQPQDYKTKGTYSVAASGYGFLSSPVSKDDYVYGLVSNGIFVASSTENSVGYNDLFIAALLPSPAPTVSTFQGAYTMMGVDFPAPGSQNGVLYNRDSTFQLNPDGNGNIGTVRATGYIAGNGSSATNQNISGVRYIFSNGAAVVNFGGSLSASSNLIAGQKYLYFSPDGNFVFGGSPTGWDMIVGVRTSSGGTPKFSGLYYQAGVVVDNSQLASVRADIQSGFGSLNAVTGLLLAHHRLLSPFNNNPVDYTYADAPKANSDGTFDDSYNHYVLGAGGAVGIALAKGTALGITALVQAPTFTGTGVYINPTGILNAGSFVPFTASVSPGELISVFGTNLASTTASDSSLPSSLRGVQVMVNGRAAPVFSVSPTQINAVIPFATTEIAASIQVINNGVPSNTVTNFVRLTSPGIFLNYINGFNYAAAQHADYSLVTPSNPARVGETLLVYLTGLGDVGASGSTTNAFTAYIDNIKATVSFAGTQSTLGGGYQLNVVVPSGIHSGNVYLDISGPDSYNSEAALPIASGGGASAVTTGSPRMRMPSHNSAEPRSLRGFRPDRRAGSENSKNF